MMEQGTTIILCEGDQSRLWNASVIKQLINFGGRPLLSRTIEQIDRHSNDAIVLNAKPEAVWEKFVDKTVYGAGQRATFLQEKGRHPDQPFLDVLERFPWNESGPTRFLYGDVIWSERMIRELYRPRTNRIWFATRFSPAPGIGTWRAEIYGFSFLPSFHGQLREMLASRKPSPYHEISDVWGLFHWLMDTRDNLPDEPSFLDAGEDDYTFDIDYPGDIEGLPILEILSAEEEGS